MSAVQSMTRPWYNEVGDWTARREVCHDDKSGIGSGRSAATAAAGRDAPVTLAGLSLHPHFGQEHNRVLLRYLADERTLSHGDWVTLAEGIKALGGSTVVADGAEQSFGRFYEERIDRAFADRFLSGLLALRDPEHDGPKMQASVARDICLLLDTATGFTREDTACRLLLVYCLYWWAAFARGYTFEVVILSDLTASGVRFVAHNLADRGERFSPYDLVLLGLRGDIKHSTYFLTAESLALLLSDFFITRWYDLQRHQWLRVALLRDYARRAVGLTLSEAEALDDVAHCLPQPVSFAIGGTMLTALGYEPWKERVLIAQAADGG